MCCIQPRSILTAKSVHVSFSGSRILISIAFFQALFYYYCNNFSVNKFMEWGFMEFLHQVPSFVKVAMIFVSILALYKAGVTLGLSILIHSIILTLLEGAGVHGIASIFLSFLKPGNYLLLIVIAMLLFFTEALRNTGRMEKTVDALKTKFKSRKILLSALPALVGLLPMPGGALFSAPMVSSLDTENKLASGYKAAINYWFRHIWEFWWPLYPGVIVAIKCSGLPIGTFFLIQMPFTVCAITGGYLFILKRLPDDYKNKTDSQSSSLHLLSALGPILILVVIATAGAFLLPYTGVPSSLANLVSMPTGLIVALAFTFKTNHTAFRKSLKLFFAKSTWILLLVVFGVLAFSSTLQMPLGDSGETIVSRMRDEFLRMHFPILLVILLIPFIAGAVTGIAVGFVGASFPLIFGLIGENPSTATLIATTSLAYACGYAGMMLSPLHICLVVTINHFKTRLLDIYKYLWKPLLLIGIFTAVVCSCYLYLI
jgi:integral membrane protein (TIGR00529 family)